MWLTKAASKLIDAVKEEKDVNKEDIPSNNYEVIQPVIRIISTGFSIYKDIKSIITDINLLLDQYKLNKLENDVKEDINDVKESE